MVVRLLKIGNEHDLKMTFKIKLALEFSQIARESKINFFSMFEKLSQYKLR